MNSVWWRGVSDAGESDKKSPWVERSRSPSKTSMISISCSQQRWKPLCLYDHPLVNSIKPRNSSTHTPHRRQQLRSEFRHRDLIHLLISRGVFIFWYLISFSLSLFPSSHFYLSRAPSFSSALPVPCSWIPCWQQWLKSLVSYCCMCCLVKWNIIDWHGRVKWLIRSIKTQNVFNATWNMFGLMWECLSCMGS